MAFREKFIVTSSARIVRTGFRHWKELTKKTALELGAQRLPASVMTHCCALKMEAIVSSETLVNVYQTVRNHMPYDSNLRLFNYLT
jgi:hypothetical protein